MAQQPFLKSIRPVNLLSFGPNTEAIELRPLNILIGPNGSGKSNLIEIIGLLSKLPDKDPWSEVIETGGVDEWIWKGYQKQNSTNRILPSILITFQAERPDDIRNYKIELVKHPATYSFHVYSESIGTYIPQDHRLFPYLNRPSDFPDSAFIYEGKSPLSKVEKLDIRLSILAQLFGPSYQRALADLPLKLSKIALYRNWIFGIDANPRRAQPVGLDSTRLAEDTRNLAQVLKAWRDRGEQAVFDQLLTLLRKFYEPVKDVDVELVGTDVRVMIKEDGLSSRTPATRLSDGTIRWLALLTILLNPTPPPVICLEEPELGLHPDIIPTLADLLRAASTRTQLILTTHSRTLVECFSDDPESVCVCEKVDGATEIRRLEADRMKTWLDKYSLGQLWSSGEIGGNRW
jgi:predicted ATPase